MGCLQVFGCLQINMAFWGKERVATWRSRRNSWDAMQIGGCNFKLLTYESCPLLRVLNKQLTCMRAGQVNLFKLTWKSPETSRYIIRVFYQANKLSSQLLLQCSPGARPCTLCTPILQICVESIHLVVEPTRMRMCGVRASASRGKKGTYVGTQREIWLRLSIEGR